MPWRPPTTGELRQRITIQRIKADAEPDDAGRIDDADDSNWETYFVCASRLDPVGAREFVAGGQVQADVTHQVTVRSCGQTREVTASMRFSYGGHAYRISGPPFDPDGRRTWITFNAVEVP